MGYRKPFDREVFSPQTSASATLARLPRPHSPSEPRRNKWNQFISTRRTRSFHQIRIDHGPSHSRRTGVRSQRHEGILERTATQTTRCFFIPNATIYANCPQQRTLVQGKLSDTPISEYIPKPHPHVTASSAYRTSVLSPRMSSKYVIEIDATRHRIKSRNNGERASYVRTMRLLSGPRIYLVRGIDIGLRSEGYTIAVSNDFGHLLWARA